MRDTLRSTRDEDFEDFNSIMIVFPLNSLQFTYLLIISVDLCVCVCVCSVVRHCRSLLLSRFFAYHKLPLK